MEANKALDYIILEAKNMVLDGVLTKNIIKHFTNRGLSEELSEKICRIAKIVAEEEMAICAK
jgi:hypothetical protein